MEGKKKQIKCLLLSVVTVLLIVLTAGCEMRTERSEKQSDREEKAGQDLYKLTMVWPYLTTVSPDLKEVEKAVSEVTEPEIGVTIELLPVQMRSTISEVSYAVAAAKKIDLCVSIFQGLDQLVNEDAILPLDDLIKDTDLEEICGVQLKGGYYGNHLLGVPVVYANGRRSGFLCRTDILEKYGISIDGSRYYELEELEKIFETVTAGEGDSMYMITPQGYLQAINIICPYDNLGNSAASGVLMLGKNTENRVVNLYATEQYREYADIAYRWAQKGYMEKDSYMNQLASDTAIREGNYFGFFVDDVTEQEGEYTARTGRDMTYIPMGEAWMKTDSYQSAIWCVTKNCENPEKVMEFLNLLYKDERLINLLQYGIEGRSYEIVKSDDKGTVIRMPEGQGIRQLPYYNEFGIYGDRLKAYIWEPGDTDRNQKIKEFSDQVTNRSPALGYVFDTEEMNTINARVKKVINSYSGLISAGCVDPRQELPLFLKDLEEAGIQTIVEENQRQYEQFLSRQKIEEN